MNIEIAKHERMAVSGSSLMRLIQNSEMPLLDLLVREAIQNSLDAGDATKKYVSVDISSKTFDAKKMNDHFDGIKDKLNAVFAKEQKEHKAIVISDCNTVGLTGKLSSDHIEDGDYGNLLKLVYEICKPQTAAGAGGSWGLGKTIYYRLGIGLVIFYSRIKQGNKYESRLAACFVEDETKPNPLLPSVGNIRRGIAWWGDNDPANPLKTIPITNEDRIKNFISIFGITPYRDNDTGTVVVVPYIDEDRLLNETYPKNEDYQFKPYWTESINSYIKVAIQKWYSPRLNNSDFKNAPYLKAYVAGKLISTNEMLPVFKVVRDLYKYATVEEISDESIINDINRINSVPINVRNIFSRGQSAGRFVFIKLNSKELLMCSPDNNRSPYQQIDNLMSQMDTGNVPIIAYTRSPGMIVGYDYNGVWTHKMVRSASNEFIIGLFVIDSKNTMKGILDIKTGNEMTFEEYVRGGEKADHAAWIDRNISGVNPKAIDKIQKGVVKKINNEYDANVHEIVERKNLGLSKALAELLLPPTDFGDTTSPRMINSPGGSTRNRKSSSIREVYPTEYKDGNTIIRFKCKVSSGKSNIELFVQADSKKINADSWEDDKGTGKKFPIEIRDFVIETVKDDAPRAKEINYNKSICVGNEKYSDSMVSLSYIESSKYHTKSCVNVVTSKDIICNVKIKLEVLDKTVKFTADVKEN